MNVKELRIGNYIIVRGSENEFNLWDGDFEPDDCFPIPLNEKWFLSFGAEFHIEDSRIKQYYLGEIKIELSKNDSEIYWTNQEPGGWKEIKYVHKLQNIYYELHDKELTIKELSK
jgi:hypothetical protein